MSNSLTCGIVSSIVSGMDNKVLENRVRRTLQRRGFGLQKCRVRDPRGYNYGRYWVILGHTGGLVDKIPGANFDQYVKLEDIAKWMDSPEAQRE